MQPGNSVTVSDVIKALENDGWVLRNVSGNHRNYKKSGARFIITIPGKLSDELSIGVLSAIGERRDCQ